ncbi:hypothetical protein [Microbulbifer sp.]|uniref:hypothetical protein n=1 Tax=Microbulbifer sp. TaxID=1908541 RepID=UPI003F38A3C1
MFKRLFASRKHPYVPGLNQREKVEMDLSGNRLTMTLPPHSDYEGFRREPPPRRVNIHDPDQYDTGELLPEWQRSGIASYCGLLADRNWELYGPPWRTRPYGAVEFRTSIWRLDSMPEGMSCFNPSHFQQAIDRALYFGFGGPAHPDDSREKAPINWRLQRESGTTGFYFESHRDFSTYVNEPSPHEATFRASTLVLPLEDRYCLGISFSYLGYAPVDYCLANMNALRDSVLESVRLELGPTARTQLAEAQRQWPRASASENRDPIAWNYPKWRRGDYRKGEPNIVILEPGSPPPEFTP